jgi:fructan beta-fructosidase
MLTAPGRSWKSLTMAAVGVAAALVVGLVAAPATAGTPADYPEYPYQATTYSEPLRGQFHFSSQGGWMNDINAPLYYRGTYHVFYQHNPHGLAWANMHWGHTTSTDLVHWKQQPIALEPGVHNATLFSGAGWVDTGNVTGLKSGDDDPILLFTNTNGVSIAYSTDGAKTFKMYDGGKKVITTSYASRDPKVTWDPVSRRWVLVIYTDNNGRGASFYSSTNLLSWKPIGDLRANWFYEVPDLYQLPVDGKTDQKKWVLQDSSGNYVIGGLNSSGMFVSDWTNPQRMELGVTKFNVGTWYASQVFNQLPTNRVVQMGWQPSNRGATWTGNASFPVELGLKTFPEGVRVVRNPVAEIAGIRTGSRSWGARSITADPKSDPFSGVAADTYEVQAEFDLAGATATEFGFELHRRADGSSDRTVAYDVRAGTLYGKSLPAVNNRVKVRMLVDRGQLEIFGDAGRFVFSDNVNFNSAASSQGIKLYAKNGAVKLVSLSFHQLKKTWTPAPGGSGGSSQPVKWAADQTKCLDRDVASGRVQIWGCLGGTNQQWALTAEGTLRTADVCVQIPAQQTANGTPVTVAPCGSGDNQRWSKGSANSLVNKLSGRCLDLDRGITTNGHPLQVWDCLQNSNQGWIGP